MRTPSQVTSDYEIYRGCKIWGYGLVHAEAPLRKGTWARPIFKSWIEAEAYIDLVLDSVRRKEE